MNARKPIHPLKEISPTSQSSRAVHHVQTFEGFSPASRRIAYTPTPESVKQKIRGFEIRVVTSCSLTSPRQDWQGMSGKVTHTYSQGDSIVRFNRTLQSVTDCNGFMRAFQTYASIASDVQVRVCCVRGGGGRWRDWARNFRAINQPPKKCANGERA